MMNLVLAIIWAGAAVFLYFYHDHGQATGKFPFPLSALAVLMALFNLVRWWGARALRNQRREMEGPTVRQRERPLRRASDERAPDPNFNFTDPAAESPRPHLGETGPK